MDKQPVGQLPDLTQSNNDDEIMVITNSEYNQLKKEKISDFITDLTSTDENNALTKGTDNKLFVTDFGNADNITEGTLPASVLPNIPKDKLPQIETADLPNSGVTAGKYIYPTNMQVNSKGQIVSVENGVTADITKEQIDTVTARPLSDNACTQEKFPDEYSYWVDQAHSTFDLSKFEVVGSPTITADGILSIPNTNLNYIKYLLPQTTHSLLITLKLKPPYGGGFIGYIGVAKTIMLRYSSNTFRLGLSSNGTDWDIANLVTSSATQITSDWDAVYLRLYWTGTQYILSYSRDNKNYITAITINSPNSVYNSHILLGAEVATNMLYLTWSGDISLPSFAVWSDGQPVFSGNKTGIDTINGILEIPYTETTDGTKIVDAAYFDRVQSCREQTGQALYLTLDEQNQQYYLPQGTVSGMISQLDAKINDTLYPYGFPMPSLDGVLHDNEIWLEGAVVSRTDYVNVFNVYGTTYGEGDGSTTFQLPDFRGKVPWGSADGTFGYIEAGLPNITGAFNGNQLYDIYANASGAFQVGGANGYPTPNSNSDMSQSGFNFDASRSNSIYSDSVTTVQPPSFKVRWKTRYK